MLVSFYIDQRGSTLLYKDSLTYEYLKRHLDKYFLTNGLPKKCPVSQQTRIGSENYHVKKEVPQGQPKR